MKALIWLFILALITLVVSTLLIAGAIGVISVLLLII